MNTTNRPPIATPRRRERTKTGRSPELRLRRLDRNNWAVERRKVHRKAVDSREMNEWSVEAHFPRLDQAAQWMFDRLTLELPAGNGREGEPSLSDLIAIVAEAQREVLEAVAYLIGSDVGVHASDAR